MNDRSSLQERRRYPRLDSLNLISYTHFDEKDLPENGGMGRTMDISKGGVTIQTHQSFSINSGLEMTIALAEKIIVARGRVVHALKVGNDLYDVGVCFSQIGEEDLKELLEYLEKTTSV